MLKTKRKKLKMKQWSSMCQMKKWPEDMRPCVGTIGKKFAKKRDRANYEVGGKWRHKRPIKAKKMFLKPQD
uniref:GekBS119P n=1 Tax=Gekko japonicus TaxID=146911 RepID=Q5EI32_GEKJA|nr:GekBS119P [Gekko japonicus]